MRFQPNLSAQAQKFLIFEKKLSLGVCSPWSEIRKNISWHFWVCNLGQHNFLLRFPDLYLGTFLNCLNVTRARFTCWWGDIKQKESWGVTKSPWNWSIFISALFLHPRHSASSILLRYDHSEQFWYNKQQHLLKLKVIMPFFCTDM